MTRYGRFGLVLSAVLLLAACGSMPDDAAGVATASSAGGSSAGGSAAPAGKPVVTIDGAKVKVTGVGNGHSGPFPLSGSVLMSSSTCAATGVIPFVWLYKESGEGAGTYVDEKTHLKNLAGTYTIVVDPSGGKCAWTIDFAPE